MKEAKTDSVDPTLAEPLPVETAVVQVDENQGHGGSYLRDPETGERILIERTQA